MRKSPPASITEGLLVRKGKAVPSLPDQLYARGVQEPAVGNRNMLKRRSIAWDVEELRSQKSDTRTQTRHMGQRGRQVARARLTLRLDEDRHLKLKLSAAHLDLSLQDIMVLALDEFLARTAPDIQKGGCVCLAAQKLPGHPQPSETE